MDTDKLIMQDLLGWSFPKFCIANIHPNYITLLALLLSAAIPFLHLQKMYGLVVIFIITRQILDCLDGTIARQCKKTSKLGGYLDTLADGIFYASIIFSVVFMITSDISTSMLYAIGIVSCFFILNCAFLGTSMLHDHTQYKDSKSKNIIQRLYSYITNNTILIFACASFIYYLYVGMFLMNA